MDEPEITYDQLPGLRAAWHAAQVKAWEDFRATWTPEQLALYKRHEQAVKMKRRLSAWERRLRGKVDLNKQPPDHVPWPDEVK